MRNLYVKYLREDRHQVICPWADKHTTESSDSTTVIFDGSNGKTGFKCLHSHCQHRTLKDVLDYFRKRTPNSIQNSVETFKGLQVINFSEFHGKYHDLQVEWIIDGLCLQSGISILAAKPKAGKSTLTRALVKSVIRGESFLGRKVKQGKCLLISLEEPPMVMMYHFKRLGLKEDEGLLIAIEGSRKDFALQLRTIIEVENPVLVIIDTLQKVTSFEDINQYNKTYEAIEPIIQVARDFKIHIMVTHHMNKNQIGGQDSILGSTGIAASFDNLIFMDRDKNGRMISTQPRFGDEIPKTYLEYDCTIGTYSVGKELKESQTETIAIELVGIFEEDSKKVFTRDELKELVSCKSQILSDALKDLEKKNVIQRGKDGKKHTFQWIGQTDWN